MSQKNEYGAALRSLRRKANLTQDQISDMIGVSRQTVGSWEQNRTSPDKNQILEWLSFCGSSFNELVSLTSELDVVMVHEFQPAQTGAEALKKNDFMTLDEMMELEKSLPEGSQVYITSLFAPQESGDQEFTRIVADNIERGIKHTYALRDKLEARDIRERLSKKLGIGLAELSNVEFKKIDLEVCVRNETIKFLANKAVIFNVNEPGRGILYEGYHAFDYHPNFASDAGRTLLAPFSEKVSKDVVRMIREAEEIQFN